MRVSQDRYERDLQRLDLARRLIRHGVRTITIRTWTGFTEERIRNLVKSYAARHAYASRHRGPPPSKVDVFLRFSIVRSEAACLAGLAQLLGILPKDPLRNAAETLPSVTAGERVCRAYELFRAVVPQTKLTLEHFIALVLALAEGSEIELAHCVHCASVIVVETAKRGRQMCRACRRLEGDEDDLGESAEPDDAPRASVQQTLF